MKTPYTIFLLTLISIALTSCEQYVDIDPPTTSLAGTTVFSSAATAEGAIIGIYSRISSADNWYMSGKSSVTYLTGLSSDEFINNDSDPDQAQFYANALSPMNSLITNQWSQYYQDIYSANAIIEGLKKSTTIPKESSEKLSAEARFIRAFAYFYLVNLFGEVPLVTTTDYKVNSIVPRAEMDQVYDLIEGDLLDALAHLPSQYTNSERVRPISATASALLARVYLYREKWALAETEATKVIEDEAYALTTDLSTTFLKESTETIWQIQPGIPGWATFDGFALVFSGSQRGVALSPSSVAAFEGEDLRFENWVGNRSYEDDDGGEVEFFFSRKYKYRLSPDPVVSPEYLVVFRLSEQYLIRAEARAHLGNIDGAKADLDEIRVRAGLDETSASTDAELLAAIEQENRVEFMSEFGHRWLDLKRTGRVDAVMTAAKGNAWQDTDARFPIPQAERQKNPNLNPQNDGY